ncbi:SETMR methyltransferase, partial [Acromyrmex heyeri]
MLVEIYDDTAPTDKSCREWFRRFKDGDLYGYREEVFNANVHKILKKHDANHYSTYPTLKTSMVERFNRTLKNDVPLIDIIMAILASKIDIVLNKFNSLSNLPKAESHIKDSFQLINRLAVDCINDNHNVLFYYRYVDDLCTAVSVSKMDSFLSTFNSFHPRLQFTVEVEDNSLNFLDVSIIIKDNHLIFDARGIIHIDYCFRHQDNAWVHTCPASMAKFNEFCELLPHPAYSPDLAPCDYFLFPNLKKWFGGKRFTTRKQLIAETEAYFKGLDKSYYLDGLKKLENCWSYKLVKAISCVDPS